MNKKLLAIVEQGGYPNFSGMYKACGFEVTMLHNMRKAMNFVRKENPEVVVAEFNHQSDFRDRTSTLESLLATVERMKESEKPAKVVVFYEKEYEQQLSKLRAMFDNFEAMQYPISIDELQLRIQSPVNSS